MLEIRPGKLLRPTDVATTFIVNQSFLRPPYGAVPAEKSVKLCCRSGV